MTDWEALVEQALGVRERAYAPYSGYRVGAALEASDGRIFTGCNIENRSYGLTVCAERAALAQAVASGADEFTALAVATDSSPPQPPCGACRETLIEFATELPIVLVNPAGERREHDLSELLPHPFKLD